MILGFRSSRSRERGGERIDLARRMEHQLQNLQVSQGGVLLLLYLCTLVDFFPCFYFEILETLLLIAYFYAPECQLCLQLSAEWKRTF